MSVLTCDSGQAGGLPAPMAVQATNGTFDDRIVVNWDDQGDTEYGFEIYRGGVLIATTMADAEEYGDFAALQDVPYQYCVRAFSKADPLNPSYSGQVCTADTAPGLRAVVLAPQEVAATDDDFEDRIAVSWRNPSSTAMLFLVRREGTVIEVLDLTRTSTEDLSIPTDTDLEYCVSAATVLAPEPASLAGKLLQVMQEVNLADAVNRSTGGEATSAADKMNAVYEVFGLDEGASTAQLAAAGFVESPTVCDDGRRALAGPTEVDATDNEFEDHVQLTWTDNSDVEVGFTVYRSQGGSTEEIATLSANRTTYGDYAGAPGVQYVYTVEAFDDYDASTAGTDEGMRTLKPPTGFFASDGLSETEVTLAWSDNSSAELGYHVYRKLASEPPTAFSLVDSTGRDETGYTDLVPDASLGIPFEYKIAAFDRYGESLSLTNPGQTAVRPPADVNASEVYTDRIVVVWVDLSAVEDEYVLTRRKVGDGSPDLTQTLAAGTTSFLDLTASAGRYEYCVAARLMSGGQYVSSMASCGIGSQLEAGVPPDSSLSALMVGNAGSTLGYGTSVAIDGPDILVGSPNAIRFHIFAIQGDTLVGGNYLHYTVAPFEKYGYAVAKSGDYIVSGDPIPGNANRGYFSIHKREGASYPLRHVHQNDGFPSALGWSAAMQDSFAVVGDPLRDDTVAADLGEAIVCNVKKAFREDNHCASAARLSRLVPMGSRGGEFGRAVGITRVNSRLYVLVGAPEKDFAFLFKCDAGCDTQAGWSYVMRLVSPSRPNEDFGAAVAIGPEIAVVGVPGAEGIVLYERSGDSWVSKYQYAPESGAAGFGKAVAVRGDMILVGAPDEEFAPDEAGAAYAMKWDAAAQTVKDVVRYDARVVGNRAKGGHFGTSVAIGDEHYLVGAPEGGPFGGFLQTGAAYLIPFGLEAPTETSLPPDVELLAADEVRASDGTAPDRIQVRWTGQSTGEDGTVVYRSDAAGLLERIGETGQSVNSYDDFQAAPGQAYTYCVAPYFGRFEGDMSCDIGWRPANGTIAGRLAARSGGGTESALVCLNPSPNRGMLFDGVGGYVEAAVGEELDLYRNFTIDAWVRPHSTNRTQFIVAKDSAYALMLNNDRLQLTLYRPGGTDEVFESALAVTAGSWHHVAATLDGDLEVKLFVDGVAGDSASAGALGSTYGDTLRIAELGNATGFFDGLIDEVRIWSIARDPATIASTRFDPLRGDEESLAGYWPMDQDRARLAPDLSESANHAILIGGVYPAESGAPIEACALSTSEGNYSISRIRYGESTEFNVVPSRPDRTFEPTFKKITLSTESPVQNEVAFTDVTAFTVSGRVQYVQIVDADTLSCPVADVRIHASKGNVAIDENVRLSTRADGSYAVALDPSTSDSDTWFIIPQLTDAENAELVHAFTPVNRELILRADAPGVDFQDLTRHTLHGNFSGGDPGVCGKNIGSAEIRIYTEDGCYDRTITVNSAVNDGAFSEDLPPLNYLVEVKNITGAPEALSEEVEAFFERLGTIEVDLTEGDVERNLIYRAPITLVVENLDPPNCPSGIDLTDAEGNPLREIPEVPVIGEYEFVPLEIRVEEHYGSSEDDTCPVGEGTVTIYDGIADRASVDSTMQLEDGLVEYTTFGASPNIIEGARVQGVDRSFQKPITVVAQVEGREPLMEAKWAIVEGYRERASTFVSATTDEFPLLILHDPPGSKSSASLEQGTTFCNTIENTQMYATALGVDLNFKFGFKTGFIAAPFGIGTEITTGGGVNIGGKLVAGGEFTSLDKSALNRAICVTTNEALTTSSDPGWVREDIHVGVALNLIFAIADVLDFSDDSGSCTVELSETLAADLDSAKPFESAYVYGAWHIEQTLIPELENLIRIAGGDPSVTGEVEGQEQTIRLRGAVDSWKQQLRNNRLLQAEALENPDVNRSISGGTQFAYTSGVDTNWTTHYQNIKLYINGEAHYGPVFVLTGFDLEANAVLEFKSEFVTETTETEAKSQKMSYTLADEDAGDYLSIDVARDPRYGTFVFGTRSGRTSNPCEANTQCRDNPKIMVDPPVRYNVSPDEAARFQLTLINASESQERRPYLLSAPAETNPGGLIMNVGGSPLTVARQYLLDPGRALTINLDVYASPSAFDYDRVGVMLYPEAEEAIWKGEPRMPFALSDTAFISVHFNQTAAAQLTASMVEGWNWFSINREGGEVDAVLKDVTVEHGDVLKSQRASAQYDSTSGWTGDLTALEPGAGYRIRLHKPGMLRIVGEAVEPAQAMELSPGWSWIGYLPIISMTPDEALASLDDRAIEGDAIVGQRGFAEYVKDVGWVGTLRELVPGESYAIHLEGGGSLTYPEPPEEVEPREPYVRETTVLGPEWTIDPRQFESFMAVVGELQMLGVPIRQTAMKLAIFDGEEIRGIGETHYVEALDRYLTFIMLYGGEAVDRPYVVHVFDGEENALYEDVATIRFVPQGRLGQPASPVVIDLANAGQAPALLDLPETFALHQNYPNPFNAHTMIGYDLPEASVVRLTVYDVLGRRVAILVDGEQPAGRHKAVFDARAFASGVYLYRMETAGVKHVGKMVLVK